MVAAEIQVLTHLHLRQLSIRDGTFSQMCFQQPRDLSQQHHQEELPELTVGDVAILDSEHLGWEVEERVEVFSLAMISMYHQQEPAALRHCVPIHLDYQCTICLHSPLQAQEGDLLP